MYKYAIISVLLLIWSIVSFADVSVRGYTKANGTYVEPSYRSNPNTNVNDNWSTKPNINPYTGVEGTKSPQPSQRDSALPKLGNKMWGDD